MPVQNYENLDTNTDVTTTRTLLHEVIPMTGTIYNYDTGAYSEHNIKNYTHGMFQTVYDYPYLSSSANHVFDITMGYDETSALSSSAATQNTKKINNYNQMSQVLLGYEDGTAAEVRMFEKDLLLDKTGSMDACFFLNFSRLLVKDQIKKGSFNITLGSGSNYQFPFASTIVLKDCSASATKGTTNTVGGDYGVLWGETVPGSTNFDQSYGILFYQAGVAVLATASFAPSVAFRIKDNENTYRPDAADILSTKIEATMTGSSISGACDALRHRIQNISFNNTTEINSKIYFCRVPHNKYNYSSNPTYTSGSKIRVKEVASDTPRAYITTVGLYNASNELLATAKLSEPLMKDPSGEIILRVRLDY